MSKPLRCRPKSSGPCLSRRRIWVSGSCALILRRVGLIEAGAGPIIVGDEANGDVLRLINFLRRNGYPYRNLDPLQRAGIFRSSAPSRMPIGCKARVSSSTIAASWRPASVSARIFRWRQAGAESLPSGTSAPARSNASLPRWAMAPRWLPRSINISPPANHRCKTPHRPSLPDRLCEGQVLP